MTFFNNDVTINASLSGASLPISALFVGGDIPKAVAIGCTHLQSFQEYHQDAIALHGQRDMEYSTLELWVCIITYLY